MQWLTNAIKFINDGEVEEVIHMLDKAIERVDGYALRGSPDPQKGAFVRDWVIDSAEQEAIYNLLIDARNALD